MNILGLHVAAHDSAACIIVDGKIMAAVEEERLERYKHGTAGIYTGGIPVRAIDFCLKKAGLKMKDIDYITTPYDVDYTSRQLPSVMLKNLNYYFNGGFWGSNVFAPIFKFKYWDKRVQNLGLNYLKRKYGHLPPLRNVEHHLAHAASTFRCSGFQRANILTIDGIGGLNTCTFSIGNGKEIEVIKKIYFPHTLGGFYSEATEMLGFKRDCEEGFTMGLAAYGKSNIDLSDVIFLDRDNGDFKFPEWERLRNKMKKRMPGEPIEKIHQDFAASVQKKLEDIIIALAEWLYNQTGYKDLCLAGGVALNACANGKLLETGFVNNIFVQPASNDTGSILGSALEVADAKFKMKGSYFGPEFSNEEIESILKTAKIKYEKSSDVCGFTAEKLEKDKVIGWFQGKCEWGPRALGNRSIIANPENPKMKDIVNNKVKHRDAWRPFAPSILENEKNKYLVNAYTSPYMILSFDVVKERAPEISATVHVDNSTRPQTVSKDFNKRYFELISKFKKVSGIPAILNTSFNIKGEPIVCSPADAIKAFFTTGMDYLILGDFILEK